MAALSLYISPEPLTPSTKYTTVWVIVVIVLASLIMLATIGGLVYFKWRGDKLKRRESLLKAIRGGSLN